MPPPVQPDLLRLVERADEEPDADGQKLNFRERHLDVAGNHQPFVENAVEHVDHLLHAQGIDDVLLTVGGTIPADDIPELKRLGVAEVFTPGAPTQDIIDFIQGAVGNRERS